MKKQFKMWDTIQNYVEILINYNELFILKQHFPEINQLYNIIVFTFLFNQFLAQYRKLSKSP
jgi:hypothetical protein